MNYTFSKLKCKAKIIFFLNISLFLFKKRKKSEFKSRLLSRLPRAGLEPARP